MAHALQSLPSHTLSRHPSELASARSFRWPIFKICSDSLPLSALPIACLRPNHTVEFCQKLTHLSTDEHCPVIMEVSGYPEVCSDGFSRGITAIPFSLGPLLPSMFLVLVPTLPLFLLLLSSTPYPFFLEKKHCPVIRSTVQSP